MRRSVDAATLGPLERLSLYVREVHKRFVTWAEFGKWERIHRELLKDTGNAHRMIDSTILCARQQVAWFLSIRTRPRV